MKNVVFLSRIDFFTLNDAALVALPVLVFLFDLYNSEPQMMTATTIASTIIPMKGQRGARGSVNKREVAI